MTANSSQEQQVFNHVSQTAEKAKPYWQARTEAPKMNSGQVTARHPAILPLHLLGFPLHVGNLDDTFLLASFAVIQYIINIDMDPNWIETFPLAEFINTYYMVTEIN